MDICGSARHHVNDLAKRKFFYIFNRAEHSVQPWLTYLPI